MRCWDESWALKAEREGKNAGSLTAAGLSVGGVRATLRGARPLLYLQWEAMGGRCQAYQEMPTQKAHAQTPAYQNSKSTMYKIHLGLA